MAQRSPVTEVRASRALAPRGEAHCGTAAGDASIPRWAVLPLRIYLGVAFLSAASNKVGTGNWGNWPGWMADVIRSRIPETPAFYRPVLADLIVPHAVFFAPLVAVTEILVGLLLVVGCATRFAGAIGLLLVFNYFLLDGGDLTGVSNDFAFVIGLVIVISSAAGHTVGVDAWLARHWPRVRPHSR